MRRATAAGCPEDGPVGTGSRSEIDAVTVSSAQGLANLFEMLDPALAARAGRCSCRTRASPRTRALGRCARCWSPGLRTRKCGTRWWHTFAPMAEDPAKPRTARAPLLLLIAIALAAALATLSGSTRAAASARRRRSWRAACATSRTTRARRARSRASRRRRMREAQVKVAQLEAASPNRRASSSRSKRSTRSCRATATSGSSPRSSRCSPSPQQQLQLAGNVRAALLALQLAEARLAQGRPAAVPAGAARAGARHRAPEGAAGARHRRR